MEPLKHLFVASLAIVFVSCQSDFKTPDTSECRVELSVRPFYQDLFRSADEPIEARISRLSADYGDYFTTFCQQEIRVGDPATPSCAPELARFLGYDENGEVLAKADSVYARLDIDRAISDAFSCYKYYFPTEVAPTAVYCHFAGFNDIFFVDSTYISFGIEHYLGASCPFYAMLEFPAYARINKTSRYLVSDLVRAWLYAVMPEPTCRQEVLTQMIYQGKILYAVHACLPDVDLATLFGMSDEQIDWCQKNEAHMWAYMAEKKLLFSSNLLDINKLTKAAPFTSFFSPQSPGRAALYCAYRIVYQYMERNPGVSLAELMQTSDAQKILQGSRYNP